MRKHGTMQKTVSMKAFRALSFFKNTGFSFLVTSPAQPAKKTFLVWA
jgi:uncharacterized protein YbbC (DUF1343 family)